MNMCSGDGDSECVTLTGLEETRSLTGMTDIKIALIANRRSTHFTHFASRITLR
jgi:hypothetical protein